MSPRRSSRCRPFFGVLVGETIYNLRSSLDYLIFDLACSEQDRSKAERNFR